MEKNMENQVETTMHRVMSCGYVGISPINNGDSIAKASGSGTWNGNWGLIWQLHSLPLVAEAGIEGMANQMETTIMENQMEE